MHMPEQKAYILKPKTRQGEVAFFILFLIVLGFTLYLFKPFFDVLFISVVAAIIISPIYKWIDKRFKLPYWLNTLLTFLLVLVALLIPLLIILRISLNQVETFMNSVDIKQVEAVLVKLRNALEGREIGSDSALPPEVTKAIFDLISNVAETVRGSLVDIAKASASVLTNMVIFIVVTFSLVPNLEKLGKYVYEISPLGNNLTELYLDKSRAITMNIIKGTFVVAFIQAVLAGLALWVIGIPYAFFLTIIMFFLSLIPMLSSYFITIPISIYLIVTGDIVAGIGLLLWQVLVVSMVDNILRPYMAAKEVKLQMAFLFLGILGGIIAFGMIGLIYGPLIIILFITSLEVYKQAYGEKIR